MPRRIPPGLIRVGFDRGSDVALGPNHTLVAGPHLSDALEVELLHAFALVGLRRIDVALGIDRDAVHAEELTRLAPAAAERGQFGHGVAPDNAYALVLPVG